MANCNILFISEMLPIDTYASSVVFYRHFKNLEKKGYKIFILTDENSFKRREKELPSSWKVILLPNRRWYFPPYKSSGILQSIRFYFYYESIKRIIIEEKIDLLMGYVYGNFLAPFVSYVKMKTKLPLISFFHDDTLELNFHKNTKHLKNNTAKILAASEKVLIASEAFIDNWPQYSNKFKLLYPIPETYGGNKNLSSTRNKLMFGYSGSVYNEIISYFELLAPFLVEAGVQLLIIGNNEKAKYLSNKYSGTVFYKPLFKTAEESNDYIKANCDAFVIPYPTKLEEMPWIKTCFPSKFIQCVQLELPILVIAPSTSALGKWCIKHKWLLYTDIYEKEDFIAKVQQVSSLQATKQVLELKRTIFNPNLIQDSLENIINSCCQ